MPEHPGGSQQIKRKYKQKAKATQYQRAVTTNGISHFQPHRNKDNTEYVLQQNQFQRAERTFKWGITLVGVAILGMALAILRYKSKGSGGSELAPEVKVIVAVLCAVLGILVIAYPWLWY